MSTDYLWHDNPCSHCGRADRYLICDSMRRWAAYPHKLLDPAHPEWGCGPESPFGRPVVSLADWRLVVTERAGYIQDQYGGRIDDPLAWLDEARPYKEIAARGGWGPRPPSRDEWLDAEGFLFDVRLG